MNIINSTFEYVLNVFFYFIKFLCAFLKLKVMHGARNTKIMGSIPAQFTCMNLLTCTSLTQMFWIFYLFNFVLIPSLNVNPLRARRWIRPGHFLSAVFCLCSLVWLSPTKATLSISFRFSSSTPCCFYPSLSSPSFWPATHSHLDVSSARVRSRSILASFISYSLSLSRWWPNPEDSSEPLILERIQFFLLSFSQLPNVTPYSSVDQG